jgi:hypothetical protein
VLHVVLLARDTTPAIVILALASVAPTASNTMPTTMPLPVATTPPVSAAAAVHALAALASTRHFFGTTIDFSFGMPAPITVSPTLIGL